MSGPCVTGGSARVYVDWNGDGDLGNANEDVTQYVLMSSPITATHGRDQARALSPGLTGSATFALCNVSRLFSPENTASALYGELIPGRLTQVTQTLGATTYPLFTGYIGDDFDVQADRSNRSVSLGALDALGRFGDQKLSTPVYAGLRTGDAVNLVLDEVNWPDDRRDVDFGATYIRFWWEDGTSAAEALTKLVNSEGEPAIAYVSPAGVFTFKDRHHRITDVGSLTSQATFAMRAFDCTSPAVTGLPYTVPFTYDPGIKNIVNAATFSVDERDVGELTTVYTSDGSFTIADGDTKVLKVQGTDPFVNAITPELNVDYTLDSGAVTVTTSRTSGQTVTLFITAVGGPATVRGVQLRAQPIPVARTIQVSAKDTESIDRFGQRDYQNDAPWAGEYDALAIAQIVVGRRAQSVPIVSIRVVNCSDAATLQLLTRDVSDRITIGNDELGLYADFYVERVERTIRGLGKVHAAVFGCERVVTQPSNVFMFDVSGHGFDQGVFGSQGLDNSANVFRFDVVGHGFDQGVFAT